MAENVVRFEDMETFTQERSDEYRRMEEMILSWILAGEPEKLREYFSTISKGELPLITGSRLQSAKIILSTASATINSHCMHAGLDVGVSQYIMEEYIRYAQDETNANRVSDLIVDMMCEYAAQMRKLGGYRGANPIVRSIVAYVNAHVYEKLSLAVIAEGTGYSEGYVCRTFKAEMGMPLTDFVQKTKVDEAKRLLRDTDTPIFDIAAMLGFSSQGYFQNVFRKVTGTTPAKWRTGG